MFTKNAFDLWKETIEIPKIITMCKDLDKILGNGIAIGSITEICGLSGCGKTQMCLQLCINVQIPKVIDGIGGHAVFIDTSNGYRPKRYEQIGNAYINYCQQVAKQNIFDSETKRIVLEFSLQSILDGTYFARALDYKQLLNAVEGLKGLLETNKNIRLIVIDSFSSVFRIWDEDSFSRTKTICKMLNDLKIIAEKYKCAVVITSEMSTRIYDDNTSEIITALGPTYKHKIIDSILLQVKDKDRKLYTATVQKSLICEEKTVDFYITINGIQNRKTS